MRIAKIHIRNILGISELEFEPGSVTEVTGRNGTGKSSVLEAIKSIVAPGHDATLLRNGEKSGEAVILLEDGTRIGKSITAAASDRFVTDPKGEQIKKPATVIASLADLISVNPVEFLHAPAKDRARILLETIPLEADVERLQEIATAASLKTPVATAGKHALVVIDAVREAIYSARTGTNRAITEKQGTIKQLEATLPPPSEAAVGDATALLAEAEKMDSDRDAEVARVNTKVAGIVSEAESRIAAIRAEAERIAEEFRQKIAAEQEGIATIRQKAAAQNNATIAKHAEARAGLTAQIATIQEAAKQAARHGVTLDHINTHKGQLGALVAESEAQTAAIDQIDAYKLEMLASLPIPGLAVVDGEVVRDGIPFDRLNAAQRVQIAIELAKLRAGELRLVCLDELERMDSFTYDEFKKQAAATDLQWFVTKVSDKAFSVSSSEINSQEPL